MSHPSGMVGAARCQPCRPGGCLIRLRQSDLKLWATCPLQWKFRNLDKLPTVQSCALTFGTVMHAAVEWMETNRDPDGAVERFKAWWLDPTTLDPSLEIEKWLPRRTFASYAQDGERILRHWWSIIEWDADVVLAREHHFVVPIGDHELEGTIDKLALRYRPKSDDYAVLVSDLKTARKAPSYNYLRHDLQFSAYCYATTQPEMWTGIENGEEIYQQTLAHPREAEWVQLSYPQRKHAGERTQEDYNRLAYAVDQMAMSIDMRIFVPNIGGDSCTFCDYREPCGLVDLETEGYYKPFNPAS